ncbi:UNVERIFIED_CONTAM: hypothetical protein FKN15_064791 [Acipenser sinensis]
MARGHDPVYCSIAIILQFLQDLLQVGRSTSTMKVYLAAISACHVPIDLVSPGAHILATLFLKGARQLRPPRKDVLSEWSLDVVF